MIMACRSRGTSLSGIRGIMQEMHHGRFLRKNLGYLLDADARARSIGAVVSQNTKPISSFGSFPGLFGGRVPSVAKIRACYLAECTRLKYTKLMWITSLTGDVLCSDHTFWATKHVRHKQKALYSALFGVMNEHGQVRLECYVLCVCGANETTFPKPYSSSTFLPTDPLLGVHKK
jgi:hypothetical protein